MPRLSLSLFGAKQLLLDGEPAGSFGYAKAFALLAYLAVEADRAHSRQALVGLLWPDLPEAAGLTNLRQVLADLRRALGDESQSPRFLLITRESIQLNPKSAVDLDVAAFLRLLSSCEAHRHRHVDRCRACLARLEEAVRLYRGDFLSGFTVNEAAPFEEWAAQRREEYHRRAQQALAHLAVHALRLGDDEYAQRILQRQLELEPWSEEVHQQLMRLYARRGQRAVALRQYECCRRILLEELGVESDAATQMLYARIRDGLALPDGAATPPTEYRVAVPVPSTTFVGREAELAHLGELLADPAQRLITILGPGGIGKTRLALAAASDQAGAFRNGICFVPLAGVTDARFLPQAILTTLDAPPPGEQALQAQLLALLRDRELLLILDNYEQLLPNVELLTQLLRRAPGVTLLVTSRERLALQAEHLVEVAGLEYPRASHDGAANEMWLEEYDALLFLQRVRQVQPGLTPEPVEQAAILRIAQISEGMPLALELAAAAVRSQSCAAVAAGLESGKQVLSARLRDLPERQRSMRAVFEHSMRLLPAEEYRVFCCLALFRGGFTVEAAADIAQTTPDTLAALVDKSLLRLNQAYRYDMHELLRQFAEKELDASGAFAQACQRYIAYFVGFANAAMEGLVGEQPGTWIARLELEIDNVHTVLRLLKHDAPEEALRMALDLFWLWQSRGFLQEGLDWLIELSNPELHIAPLLRANSYRAASFLAICLNKVEVSFLLISKCLAIIQSLDLTDRRVAEAFVHARATLTYVFLFQGDYKQVIAIGQEVVALAEKWDFKAHVVGGWYNLGEAYMMLEEFDAAKVAYEKSLGLCRQIGDLRRSGRRVARLAKIAVSQGDFEQARALCQQTVRIYEGAQDQVGLSMALLVMIWLATLQGFVKRAAFLLGATETILDSNPVLRTWPQDRRSYNASVAVLREQLDDSTFSALWAEGRAMSMEQTVAYVLSDEG